MSREASDSSLNADTASTMAVTYDELLEHKEAGKPVFAYPRFGREIHVTLTALPLLAEAIRVEADPRGLSRCQCEILRIDTSDIVGNDSGENHDLPAVIAAQCLALAHFLEYMGVHGHLREFRCLLYSVARFGPIPPQVWKALSGNSDLRIMEVTPVSGESSDSNESWNVFTSQAYPPLHRLVLWLENAHSWDGLGLHRMLKRQTELRSLRLWMPNCCGITQLSLSGTFPQLRSFCLTSVLLRETVEEGDLPTRTFLSRHPQLEHLSLYYEDDGYSNHTGFLKLTSGDLPNLRALHVDFRTLRSAPSLANIICKLEALAIDFMPRLDWPVLASSFASLRYLAIESAMYFWPKVEQEIPSSEHETEVTNSGTEANTGAAQATDALAAAVADDDDGPREESNEPGDTWSLSLRPGEDPKRGLEALLASLPRLAELRFSLGFARRPLEDYFVDYLRLITPETTPCLVAFTFCDRRFGSFQPLSPELLADVPCRLPTLRHLGWEDASSRIVYELERVEGRVVAVERKRSSSLPRDLWITETILDHFGADAREW